MYTNLRIKILFILRIEYINSIQELNTDKKS